MKAFRACSVLLSIPKAASPLSSSAMSRKTLRGSEMNALRHACFVEIVKEHRLFDGGDEHARQHGGPVQGVLVEADPLGEADVRRCGSGNQRAADRDRAQLVGEILPGILLAVPAIVARKLELVGAASPVDGGPDGEPGGRVGAQCVAKKGQAAGHDIVVSIEKEDVVATHLGKPRIACGAGIAEPDARHLQAADYGRERRRRL